MSDTDEVCPFCKEEIRPGAIKCKHCKSNLAPKEPEHEGTCPFCKEDVKPSAIKCKHCGSMIGSDVSAKHHDCNCSTDPSNLSDMASLAMLLRDNGQGYGWGQECFYRCIDTEECPPGFESLCHSICEIKCAISMPRNAFGGRSVFRR